MKYLRIKLFYRLLTPFSKARRERRMASFARFAASDASAKPRILDLGGQPEIWDSVGQSLDITLLNLPGVMNPPPNNSHHSFHCVEGDACSMPYYRDGEFDIVFSNSVIEHVGDLDPQVAFAGEVQRVGRRFWVQTPSMHFPIEAHCGMPCWWYYPQPLRNYFIRKWKAKMPAWTEMIEGTRVLSKRHLQQLFPGARVRTERILGVPKSYIISSTG